MNEIIFNQNDFMNREISWLAFNNRILDLADNNSIPIFERANFLKITQSNLDEWYMVRVANLIREVQAGDKNPDKSGMAPNTQLNQVRKLVKKQLKRQSKIWTKLKNKLNGLGIKIIDYKNLTVDEKNKADNFFQTTINPLIDIKILPKRIPKSDMQNGNMYFIVDMTKSDDHVFAYFKMPPLNRLYILNKDSNHFILLDQIIEAHYQEIIKLHFDSNFLAQNIYLYRILKDMDIRSIAKKTKDTEQAVSLAIEKQKNAPVIFLALDARSPRKILKILTQALSVNPLNTFHISGDWDYDFIKPISQTVNLNQDDLYFKKHYPRHFRELESCEIFSKIQRNDYLLYHPYDSYDAVVNFFEQAAIDQNVKKIYVTIYRTSHNSPIIKALAKAAEKGKDVYALIEVKARFDEEHNIKVADYLRKQGVHVYTSFPDLKIHSKMALVIKKDDDHVVEIAHLATGNYNEQTAKSYTDYSFFTARKKYTRDIMRIFEYITGEKEMPKKLHKLYIAPNMLRDRIKHEIKRTTKKSREGEKSEIWIKCNSLSDYKIITALYKASTEGVTVHLLIRGLTTAIPQIPDVSTHLHIHSIVGRLLEHSRVYIFKTGKYFRCYLSSADVMPRNLDRRVETLFPIEDDGLKEKIYNDFERMWNDRAQSYTKKRNGTYQKRISNKDVDKYVPIQEQLLIEAEKGKR